ncbi:hypothetical protein HW555_005872 [Spodoptera exigua]|uniref:C2H2-type domain-containing protein n=1 Tax=Spodoptera exigua TaxID=7107 RepID=A0A835GK92_SPOEX|nr:hypothetical protein HW555_005872 [Spodoptera exigua]
MKQYTYKQNDSEMSKLCICCASQSPVLINMSTCKHTGFLTNYLKLELDLKKMYMCNLCHNLLKKIELFKQQVEESFALLLDQAPILKINKVHNLQISPLAFTTNLPDVEVETEIKIEPINENISETEELKNEIESSDNDTEIPLAVLKNNKRKRKKDVRYEGKIKTVFLSEDDLRIEREKMAAKENYLKLPYKCELCIVAFDHELTLQSHNEGRHKKVKNGFECNVCKSTLSTKFSYKEHVQRHYRRLECMVCHKRYNHMSSAIQHYTEQHSTDDTLYSCRMCEYTTSSNRAYRYHMDKHKEKPSCSICGNQFVNSNGLKVHMFTVHQQSSRKYKCEECNKQYKARSGLEAHQKSAHATPDTRAFCVVCKTYYRNRQSLVHHMNTHSKHVGEGDKRFICDECGAKFLTKSSLQVHINWEHLKIHTHSCIKCTKVFKNNYLLNRHVSFVHNKKRPPRNKICDYCGRAFTTQTILRSHIRTHTGERPLQCTHCTATFAHPAALYTHNKLLHSGNK